MDCLRSFNIGILQTGTFTPATSILSWWISSGTGDIYWTFDLPGSSKFLIQGFKNIDLYGIEMIGGVKSQTGTASNCVVQQSGFQIYCDATNPLVSGSKQVSPDFWNINFDNVNSRKFQFTNTLSKIDFASPLKSLKSIEFLGLQAEGFGLQSPGTLSLEWDLNFVFYYKYEGE
jgi:hypothetical protein